MMPKATRSNSRPSGCKVLRDFIAFLFSGIEKRNQTHAHFNRKAKRARPRAAPPKNQVQSLVKNYWDI
jgi:hypothetical protein